jgi:small-conductance mechanosensitive channel
MPDWPTFSHHLIPLAAQWLNNTWTWVAHFVLVRDTLVQLGAMLIVLGVVRALIHPLRRWVRRKVRWLPPALRGVGRAIADVAAPLLGLLLLWFCMLADDALGLHANLLRFAESILFVTVLIRVSSKLIRNAVLARAVAIIAWIIAVLNIVGLIDPVSKLLAEMAIPIGNYQVSVLLVLKGMITLSVLLWLANVISRASEQRLQKVVPLSPSMEVLAEKAIRIVLLTLAVVIGLGSIGIDLTAFAVFSGAVGVGVGFGLQKVVSNLVSGVIILLDRSIKPGDVIEIDSTYGSVGRLNARYVSVKTRDCKEYLIPNEDLITHRVINWSYSDSQIRLHVRFVTINDADPHQVLGLAITAVRDIPRVLTAPKPACLLIGFDGNSQQYELRFWIDDPANGTAGVRSAVLLQLWDVLQEHGIKQPSSQYEITISNLDDYVRRDAGDDRLGETV